MEDLEPVPELGRLLADGGVLLGRLKLVALLDEVNVLPLTHEQILAGLFVAFGLKKFRFLCSHLCSVIGGRVAQSEGSRANRLAVSIIKGFIVIMAGRGLILTSLLVNVSLEDLLVFYKVPGGVIKAPMRIMATNPEAGRVDGSPSAIQISKGGKDPDDGLERAGDLLGFEVVVNGVLDDRIFEGYLVSRFRLKIFP